MGRHLQKVRLSLESSEVNVMICRTGTLLVCLISLLCISGLHAQRMGLAEETPFRKGRFLVGAGAQLSSSNIKYDEPGLRDSVFSNNYTILLRADYFLRERLSLGLLFTAHRTNTTEVVTRELETLSIGPNLRYYVSKSEEGSVFLEGRVSYSRLNDNLKVALVNVFVDTETKGSGIDFRLGAGYSYVLYDHITIEMAIGYNRSIYGATTKDNLQGTKAQNTVYSNNFTFGLGINVLMR